MTITASAAASVAKIASIAASQFASAAPAANPSADAWFNGFATLVGALVGALAASWIAYRLQLRAVKKKERETALVEAHQIMFCLVQQINTVLLTWKDHYGPNVDSRGRFLNVPATTPFDLNRHVIDVAKMTILLDCRKGRAVLYDLNIAQEGYRETLLIMNERSLVHKSELQTAMERSDLGNHREVSDRAVAEAVGGRLMLSMIGLTDASYMMLHKTFAKLSTVKDSARQYVVERFGTDDFTKVDFSETYGIEKEPTLHYAEAAKLIYGAIAERS